ncbi:MAG: DNA repair protein RecO [Clostridia bacterium]|nr:DNA repair protein RecO [Clostridia bacterium]MDD4375716.1 DNA repair protein RecO [Clostridia bacterium]
MKLVKVKGIVIKEVQYKENDKIITIMTDKLGKISCMAKAAKKNNSPLLSTSQFLVYSEFLLYKGTNFYHVNSAEMIDSFYSLRVDYEKLNKAFEVTKILNKLAYEEEEKTGILSLYLNTLFIIQKMDKQFDFVRGVFILKLLCLLGYAPNMYKCLSCNKKMLENNKTDIKHYYDKTTNAATCSNCYSKKNEINKKHFSEISEAALYSVLYVISSDIKKTYSFEIKGKTLNEFYNFVNDYYLSQML